jgi:hypothetical protein
MPSDSAGTILRTVGETGMGTPIKRMTEMTAKVRMTVTGHKLFPVPFHPPPPQVPFDITKLVNTVITPWAYFP